LPTHYRVRFLLRHARNRAGSREFMVTMSADTKKLCDLIGKFRTAMLVTHAPGSQLRAVPMAVAQVEATGRVWFITARDSGKVHDLEGDGRVQLVFSDDRSNYLTIAGQGSLSTECAKINEVWTEAFKVWFPGGREDPSIALIAVDPERAEFWDNSGFHKLQYLWEAARAYIAGDKPHVREGELHGVLRP
jgi:general stress protein 26